MLPRQRREAAAQTDLPTLSEAQEAPVLLCGFGRYGQIVGRLLFANGLKATVLEHDAEQVESIRRFGFRVHYGDATRLDLLRIAGAAQARVIVVAVDDVDHSLEIVDLAREHFPQATLVARARNVGHYYALRDRGVDLVERETFDAALMSGRSVLEQLGWQPHHARQLAMRFRRHNIDLLAALRPHRQDQAHLIALAKQGRAQLEEQFARERIERHGPRPGGWDESA